MRKTNQTQMDRTTVASQEGPIYSKEMEMFSFMPNTYAQNCQMAGESPVDSMVPFGWTDIESAKQDRI